MVRKNGVEIAVIRADGVLLKDAQSALDLMATVMHETGASRLVLRKEQVAEDFFILRSRIAGEVLQKFVTYGVKLAIVGDFSGYESKSLRDFITESNRGRDIFFVATQEEAVDRLEKAI